MLLYCLVSNTILSLTLSACSSAWLIDYTEPICQMIDSSLAQMLTFDTSGIDKSIYQSPNLVFKKQHIFLDMLAFLYDLIILPLLT